MNVKLTLATGLLAGFLLPAAAFAACSPPLVAADKNGAAQNMEAVNTAAGNCAGVVSTYPAEAVSATLQSSAVANGNGTALTVTGSAAVGVTVNCSACSGGTTINFEGNTDASNYGPICMTPLGGGTCQTTTTTAGITQWERPTGGLQQIRARISGYSAGTITATAEAVPVGGTPGAPTMYQGTSPWVTNLTQFGSSNVVTGTGASGAGIPRVTLSNDSTLAANQSVNVAQFGGTSTVTGTGVSGNGVPRVTVSNDSAVKLWDGTNVGAFKASGANAVTSDPSAVVALSPNPSTVCTNQIAVSQTASTDIYTSTNKVHICGIVLSQDGSSGQHVSVTEGTGTTCATGSHALIGSTTAASGMYFAATGGGFSSVSSRPWLESQTTADHICVLQDGTGRVAGVISYTDHN